MSAVISDPRIFVALLITLGIILSFGIFLLYRRKQKSIRNAGATAPAPAAAAPGRSGQISSSHAATRPEENAPVPETGGPKFTTFQRRSGLGTDLLRALLLAASLVVVAALVLVLLPQPTVDAIARYFDSRHRAAQPEKIAFLYLGDETADGQFRIRGVVRNITPSPMERLDAIVRFYAQDRSLLETNIVRMNKETIGPNEIAQFELVYPSGRIGFAGYSAEFKLRQGPTVPYRDLRKLPVQSK